MRGPPGRQGQESKAHGANADTGGGAGGHGRASCPRCGAAAYREEAYEWPTTESVFQTWDAGSPGMRMRPGNHREAPRGPERKSRSREVVFGADPQSTSVYIEHTLAHMCVCTFQEPLGREKTNNPSFKMGKRHEQTFHSKGNTNINI